MNNVHYPLQFKRSIVDLHMYNVLIHVWMCMYMYMYMYVYHILQLQILYRKLKIVFIVPNVHVRVRVCKTNWLICAILCVYQCFSLKSLTSSRREYYYFFFRSHVQEKISNH